MTTSPPPALPAPPAPRKLTINRITLVCAGVFLVCLVLAAVGLAFAGWDPGQITAFIGALMGLAAPVLALLERSVDAGAELGAQTAELGAQTTTLNVVAGRLNGDLDRRLNAFAEASAAGAAEAARSVLERFLNSPTAAYPTLPPPAGTLGAAGGWDGRTPPPAGQ